MCGRYTFYSSDEIIKEFNFLPKRDPQLKLLLEVPDNYNVAPGQTMPVIVRGEQSNIPVMMRWGLIPSWAKDEKIGYKLINAREETLYEKPVWKRLVKSKRCIIPAKGFYEWKSLQGVKQPYYIKPKSGKFMSFAGLWDEWTNNNGDRVLTYTIITTAPNKEMSELHDRMPVTLDANGAEVWLSPLPISQDLVDDLLVPAPDGSLTIVAVSKDVNSVKNNYKELIYAL